MSGSEEEHRVQFIVRYNPLSQKDRPKRYEVTLNDSTLLSELFDQVGKHMQYEPDTFKLIYQAKSGDREFTKSSPETLKSAGFSLYPSRNSLVLDVIKESEPKPSKNDDDKAMKIKTPEAFIPFHNEITFASPPVRRSSFVGLVNQAMTCYLNSLLQALYMTPEFRNALYIWKFDGNTEPNMCIPYQLQKLFLNLQTSTRIAVETTELTRSFGWVSGEVWQQQDIQELCRVMFDALEHEFKDTEQADLINRLYQGKMTDYVECLVCRKEKCREDTFLDIPLPVRPFGSTVAYGSITEALNAFVLPETLDGNNQYFCESCNSKCDAHKGLKFTKFPYLLTLHLKRFDFDYSSMNRIKLNDKVSFPEILDLNKFIKSLDEPEEGIEQLESSETSMKCDSTVDSPFEEESMVEKKMDISDLDQEEDEGIDLSSNGINNHENNKNGQDSKPSGPFVYELYSIMIHSGSASGGHYYAYIKDFSKGEWHCFNDQTVTTITREDIEKTYGGGPTRGYYSGAYSSSTNAYMLMYRQIDKDKNCTAMTEENFPPHIKETLKDIKKAEEEEKAMKARQEEMVKMKIFAIDLMNDVMIHEEKIHIYGYDTLADATRLAWSKFNLENIIAEDQCRLVLFNRDTGQIEMSLEAEKDKPLNQILKSKPHNIDFLLEFRDKNKPFMPYTSEDIHMVVHVLDPELGEIQSSHHVRTTPNQQLSDLRQFFSKALSLNTMDFHIILTTPKVCLLNDDNKCQFKSIFCNNRDTAARDSMRSLYRINPTCKVFVCPKGTEGDDFTNFESSQLYKLVKELQHVISLEFIMPLTCEVNEKLWNLLIPPLEEEKNSESERPMEPVLTSDNQVCTPLVNGANEEEAVFGGTSDQSTSEDSSLTDSERTIIGEQNECQLSSGSDSEQLSSPEPASAKSMGFSPKQEEENWDEVTAKNLYFSASPFVVVLNQNRRLKVVVDVRMPIPVLKSKLEKYVCVSSKYLKLTKGMDPDSSGIIVSSLQDLRDDDKVKISLHRVLNDGEVKVKVYRLSLSDSGKVEFFFDWVITLGTTVGETKKAMLKELERRNPEIKIPYDRFRLRKKFSRSVGSVLLDHEVWDKKLGSSVELFVQILDKPEQVNRNTHSVIFARRWHTSSLSLGPLVEVVLESPSLVNFKQKLSEISDIPMQNIEVAKGDGTSFQDEIQPLLLTRLNWTLEDDSGEDDCKYLPEDDTIVFFRDREEEMKKLSKEEEIRASCYEYNRENRVPSFLNRKEKALKIYWSNEASRPRRSVIDVD
ncbi:ubiquitin carboxyl-terminal hydrolase 47-like isoform X2 [Cimex lectularius]|nr:ubiquitin carboxyl-terminal hydrolase 47-like isoform X2 [Cimex lectularius]